MKTWTFPALIGIGFILAGYILFVHPEIIAYIIASLFVIIGISLLFIAFTMWKEAKALQKVLRELEEEAEFEEVAENNETK